MYGLNNNTGQPYQRIMNFSRDNSAKSGMGKVIDNGKFIFKIINGIENLFNKDIEESGGHRSGGTAG